MMDGNSLGKVMANAVFTLAVFFLVVGLIVGGGCAFVLTSGCMPSVKVVWPAG